MKSSKTALEIFEHLEGDVEFWNRLSLFCMFRQMVLKNGIVSRVELFGALCRIGVKSD